MSSLVNLPHRHLQMFHPCLDLVVAREMVNYQKVLLKKCLGVSRIPVEGEKGRDQKIRTIAQNYPEYSEKILSLLKNLQTSERTYRELSEEHVEFSRSPECICFV